MRLVNVHTLKLRDFHDTDPPPYAIASHRWHSYECTSRDFTTTNIVSDDTPHNRQSSNPMTNDEYLRAGYLKVKCFCEAVKRWKYPVLDWLWIDTCCIDRTSSTELSEAINSMYRWYSEAYVCLAYLDDVTGPPSSSTIHDSSKVFQSSDWFTRGWTLKELIAPQLVVFLNREWVTIGLKASASLAEELDLRWSREGGDLAMLGLPLHKEMSAITDIPEAVLRHQIAVRDVDIMERLQWMRHRSTTRSEDHVRHLRHVHATDLWKARKCPGAAGASPERKVWWQADLVCRAVGKEGHKVDSSRRRHSFDIDGQQCLWFCLSGMYQRQLFTPTASTNFFEFCARLS